MKKLAFLFLLIAFCTESRSQVKEIPMNIGIYGGLNFNMHSPDFRMSTAVNSIFNKNATSLGGHFGFIGNFPLDNNFVITTRLGYNTLGGDLKSVDDSTLETSIGMLEITPGMQFHNLFSGLDLYLLAGLEIGIPISNSYTYYLNGNAEQDIPEANTRIALALGAGWMFEPWDDVFLSPEISYRLPFGNVSNSASFDTWNIPQLRLGVNLTFSIESDEPEKMPEVKTVSDISVGFKEVRAYDKNGNMKTADKISVEELQYSELFPIVPYVFFDEKSEYPAKKTQNLVGISNQAGSFSIDNLSADAEKINSNTLDIVGLRMQKDKYMTIKIVGTLDGRSEANNKELAMKRAEFAKSYITSTYGIEENRITTESSNFPSKPSTLRDPLGVEENRRVEIYATSSVANALDPIVIKSDKQRLANPDIIEFIPFADTQDSIAGWDLEVMQAGRLIKKYSGTGKPQSSKWYIMPNDLAASEIPVDYSFKAWTVNQKRATASGTIPVEYFSITRKKTEERADRTISKFSLILFDFNSPDISEADRKILINNIIPEIKFNSTVQIYGYTDVIGDEDYNKKLAMQRAENVKSILSEKIKDAKYEVYGVGESVQVFNNNSTTGRQLSRTVQIYIITPKN